MAYIKALNPEQQEMYDYLERLRQSGDTNMFGAGAYLQAEFDLERKEAGEVLTGWMRGHSDPARKMSKPVSKKRTVGRFVTHYERDAV